jgi:hypothetical protein
MLVSRVMAVLAAGPAASLPLGAESVRCLWVGFVWVGGVAVAAAGWAAGDASRHARRACMEIRVHMYCYCC